MPVGVFEHYIACDIVCDFARVAALKHIQNYIRRHLRRKFGIFLKKVFRFSDKSLGKLVLLALYCGIVLGLYFANKIVILKQNRAKLCPAYTLNRYADIITVGYSQNMIYLGYCADFIKFIVIGVVFSYILLCNEKDLLVFCHCGFKCGNGFFSSDIKIDAHTREHHKTFECNRRH